LISEPNLNFEHPASPKASKVHQSKLHSLDLVLQI